MFAHAERYVSRGDPNPSTLLDLRRMGALDGRKWTRAAESLGHSDTRFLCGLTGGSNKSNDYRAQFGDGCTTLSMTITSTGARDDSNFIPSCSCMAVNSDGALASAGGGGTLIPILANWVSSGVHVSV